MTDSLPAMDWSSADIFKLPGTAILHRILKR